MMERTSSLLDRRLASNPLLKPLEKLKCSLPTTKFRVELISDGIERGVQAKYSSRGCQYPTNCAGTRFHYTVGAIPALITRGTARQGSFGQVVVDVGMKLEAIITALLSTALPLRRALRCDNVKKLKSNFFPVSMRPDEKGEKQRGTAIYVKECKQVPLSVFQFGHPSDVLVYPSTLSYNRDHHVFTCRLGVVPADGVADSSFDVRSFCDGDDDGAVDIPPSEMANMMESFKKLWQDEDEVYDDDGLFA